MSTLVLDNTVGGETANSYGSVEEMVSYFTGRSDAADFLVADTQEQIARLIQATTINDLLLYANGSRTTEEQALEFPRRSLTDSHGRSYSETDIPSKIKYAQFEQALYLYTTNIKMPSMLMQGFKSAKLDVMSVTVDKTMIPTKLDYDALDFLSEFGTVDRGHSSGTRQVNVFRY